MSDKVTVPAELRDKLAGANGYPIPLCDEAGAVVGYFLSPTGFAALQSERAAAYELAGALASETELDAAEARGGARAMDDVFKLLGPR
jgi:hypothetical protein